MIAGVNAMNNPNEESASVARMKRNGIRDRSMREAFRRAGRERPLRIDAIVVLPDPLHTIWMLPPDDAEYVGRGKHIKSLFSRFVAASNEKISKNIQGEYAKNTRCCRACYFGDKALSNGEVYF
jgi:Transposase and inactivated derivatives